MAKFSPQKIQNFRDFYENLGKRKRKNEFRDAICTQVGWAYSTFYYKLKNGNIYRDEAPMVRFVMCQFEKK